MPKPMLRIASACLMAVVTAIAACGSARAASFRYFSDDIGEFGVLNFNTGVATICGDESETVFGLAIGPDKALYGAAYSGNFYKIDTANGSETLISNLGVNAFDVGSTTKAVYALTQVGDLYSVNVTTGAGTLVGNVGFSVTGGTLSIGSKTLYLETNTSLYTVNTQTAAATYIGDTTYDFEALQGSKKKLYGADITTLSLYSINPASGAITLIAPITGISYPLFGLAPTPKSDTGACMAAARAGRPYVHPAARTGLVPIKGK